MQQAATRVFTRVPHDFDGDGDSDALMQSTSGRWRVFNLEDGERVSHAALSLYVNEDWRLLSIADFDDDKKGWFG